MQRSRAVWLRDGINRQVSHNSNTIGLADALSAYFRGARGAGLPPPEPESFADRFVRCYGEIRALCVRASDPGLALVAVDERGVAAASLLAARPGRITAAVVGRHNMAELYLPGDPTLSLRHALVLLHPLGGDVRFRLLDLRTSGAFRDEQGRRLEALEAEGPVIVGCARYSFFLLPVGGELDWPESALDAWHCIPERIYLRDVDAEPDRWQRRRLRRNAVRPLTGPATARERMVADGEHPVGELRLDSRRGHGALLVGPSALDEGVLLGRAPRCDASGLGVLADDRISRVHALVVRIAGEVYAVDVASTQGLWLDGQRVTLAPLGDGTTLEMDSAGTRLQWRLLN